jgi:hypothetical protein
MHSSLAFIASRTISENTGIATHSVLPGLLFIFVPDDPCVVVTDTPLVVVSFIIVAMFVPDACEVTVTKKPCQFKTKYENREVGNII